MQWKSFDSKPYVPLGVAGQVCGITLEAWGKLGPVLIVDLAGRVTLPAVNSSYLLRSVFGEGLADTTVGAREVAKKSLCDCPPGSVILVNKSLEISRFVIFPYLADYREDPETPPKTWQIKDIPAEQLPQCNGATAKTLWCSLSKRDPMRYENWHLPAHIMTERRLTESHLLLIIYKGIGCCKTDHGEIDLSPGIVLSITAGQWFTLRGKNLEADVFMAPWERDNWEFAGESIASRRSY